MVQEFQRRDYPGGHANSLIGYYRAFAGHNVPVDFIHREHLENQEFSQYKLVIVPWPLMFTQPVFITGITLPTGSLYCFQRGLRPGI